MSIKNQSLLCIALAFAFVSCGEDKKDNEKKSSNSTAPAAAPGKADSGTDARVFGHWDLRPDGVVEQSTLVIEPGIMKVLMKAGSLRCDVATTADFSSESITVLKEVYVKRENLDNGDTCTSYIDKGTYLYKLLDANTLKVTEDFGARESMVLKRL